MDAEFEIGRRCPFNPFGFDFWIVDDEYIFKKR